MFSLKTIKEVYFSLNRLIPQACFFFSSWLGEGSTLSCIKCQHWAFYCSQRALAAGSFPGHPEAGLGGEEWLCQTGIAYFQWGWLGAEWVTLPFHAHQAEFTSLEQMPVCQTTRGQDSLLARNLLCLLSPHPQESDCPSPARCVALSKLLNLSVVQVLVWKNGTIIALSWRILRIKCLKICRVLKQCLAPISAQFMFYHLHNICPIHQPFILSFTYCSSST